MSEQPLHVGLILDGNRRFSQDHGHRAGAENFKRIMERARNDQKINLLAAWCLSCKNLEKRPSAEIDAIFHIATEFLDDLRDNWMDEPENQNLRLLHMGRRDRMKVHRFGFDVLELLDLIAEETRERTGMIVALCFDYSGKNEQARAHRAWMEAGAPGNPEDGYQQYLDLPTQGVPFRQVDLVIRTGKETKKESERAGAFLHPYFVDGETRQRSTTLLFPQFTPSHFAKEVEAYLGEKKREGA